MGGKRGSGQQPPELAQALGGSQERGHPWRNVAYCMEMSLGLPEARLPGVADLPVDTFPCGCHCGLPHSDTRGGDAGGGVPLVQAWLRVRKAAFPLHWQNSRFWKSWSEECFHRIESSRWGGESGRGESLAPKGTARTCWEFGGGEGGGEGREVSASAPGSPGPCFPARRRGLPRWCLRARPPHSGGNSRLPGSWVARPLGPLAIPEPWGAGRGARGCLSGPPLANSIFFPHDKDMWCPN